MMRALHMSYALMALLGWLCLLPATRTHAVAVEGDFYKSVEGQGEAPAARDFIWLESLDLKKMRSESLPPRAGKSAVGRPLTLKNQVYPHGLGTAARSLLAVDLKGVATQFSAHVGVDDGGGSSGSVSFEVWLDGRKVVDTGVIESGQPPQTICIDLTGARRMELRVEDGGDGPNNDVADWANAMIRLVPGATARLEAVEAPTLSAAQPWVPGVKREPSPEIAPLDHSPRPAIHGPRIIGATPGRPMMFLIPATGEGPLRFRAKGLPAGLNLDERTGIISGRLVKAGRTVAGLTVQGPKGTARRQLTIVGGEHKLALTPPMVWSSWYPWGGDRVSDQKIREAADCLVSKGLAAHGYQYVVAEEPGFVARDAAGRYLPTAKFPDMKALGEYIHGKGLKFGIYSSPGPTTCAGFLGSYGHEELDALTFSEWGVDFLNYDLCGYLSVDPGATVDARMRPLKVMRKALDLCGRDVVFKFGGWGDTSEWGTRVGLNTWRLANDITPKWSDLRRVALSQYGAEQQSGPGHWNDADMLMIGPSWFGSNALPLLTGNEQVFHMTHWCMSAAPLTISCNLALIDDFSLALLGNDEVIEVDQDPLGVQGRPVCLMGEIEVLARPLVDGTKAVALLNWGEKPVEITARWADLRLAGPQPVRDLWRRKELGTFDGSFKATVGRHGAVMLKVGKPRLID